MSTIRVAIAGVGNCASSLLQGLAYYRETEPGDGVPGLMHVTLGGYHVRDVEVVAAFDVDASKVGLDVSKAVRQGQATVELLVQPHQLSAGSLQLAFEAAGSAALRSLRHRHRRTAVPPRRRRAADRAAPNPSLRPAHAHPRA